MTAGRAVRDVREALTACRRHAAGYLAAQVVDVGSVRAFRHSPTHDPSSHPGHLLYGTWAGVLAGRLIGVDRDLSAAERERIAAGLNRFQRADGTFFLPGIPDDARQGHDDEYIATHCTNYALGALRALGVEPQYPLSFVDPLLDGARLANWLDERDWSRPWNAGNKVVNLASFHAVLAEHGNADAAMRLREMAEWHDAHQHPVTGFWQQDAGRDRDLLCYAMAGAAHVLHLYYYLDRTVPHADRMIDSCLRLGYQGIQSACLDIDMVDILTHLRRCGHRRREIDDVLERYLVELLQVQNADGGFSDGYVVAHRLYGHTTPADVSVTWTTWFRLATIGMAAMTLLPEERGRWWFRTTLGSGYFNASYALQGSPGAERFGRHFAAASRARLALVRSGRFARQRAVARVRGLIRTAG